MLSNYIYFLILKNTMAIPNLKITNYYNAYNAII